MISYISFSSSEMAVSSSFCVSKHEMAVKAKAKLTGRFLSVSMIGKVWNLFEIQ